MNIIDDYFKDLEKHLSDLPSTERRNYINELRDHLFALIEEKKQNGLSEKEAVEFSIKEFPTPYNHAKKYLETHKDKLYNLPSEKIDFKFRYTVALIVMGIAELALLFTDKQLNLYLAIIGIVMFSVGNTILMKRKKWNEDNIKQIYLGNIAIWLCLAIGLFFFFYRDIFNTVSISYMAVLLFLIIIQHFIFYRILKKKNHKI